MGHLETAMPVRSRLVFAILAALVFTAPPCRADYEVDHRSLIQKMDRNPETLKLGSTLYQQVCIICHGDLQKPGSLPTALRFGEGVFKNGNDPRSMYRTLTQGFNQMVAQPWMTPEQKYAVIHYIRETFLKTKNPKQYFKITSQYLNQQSVEQSKANCPQRSARSRGRK